MDKELYLLGLILKKHKINSTIDASKKQVEIGKASGNNKDIAIYFGAAIIIFAALLFLQIQFNFGRVFLYAIPVSSFFYGINKYIGSQKANRFFKTISPKGITLKNKEDAIEIPAENILKIDTVINVDDPSGSEGDLNIVTSENKTHLLFNITGSNVKYLKDDLENLKRIINGILNSTD
ncbi:hypothetical protein [uncultured Dokdonia sp.]|uniref:hypothetical protein n=1 Tax=uncultured Dokdonia sp. TaxID=575653 RepID=UPI0026036022|nr:hypothetical protein [uncultured Dokdonia sp.]